MPNNFNKGVKMSGSNATQKETLGHVESLWGSKLNPERP